MDPAMPDWRAFGQPVTVAAATPEPTRTRTPWQLLDGLSPTARVGLVLAAVTAVLGLALALLTPPGGGLAMADDPAAQGRSLAGSALEVAGDSLAGRPLAPDTDLVVDVAGAVARPGLVRLTAGSRVGDALAAAGGYAPDADLRAVARDLNLAAPLEDGAKVLVAALTPTDRGAPGPGGQIPSPDAGRGSDGDGEGLNLNAATQAALEALPGIGPVTAARILEARSEAPFTSIDDLRARGLVGESTFGRLRGLVTVGP